MSVLINVPSIDTFVSREHGIYINDKLVRAKNLVNDEGIVKQDMDNQMIYNVLLKEHGKMIVNNMIVETLDPTHEIAKQYL